MTDFEVRIYSNPATLLHELWIFRKRADGKTEVLQPDMRTVKTVVPDGAEIKPTVSISDNVFSKLVDAIHKDYKPSQGLYTEGKLEATEKHLEDMRRLVFESIAGENRDAE